MVCIEKRPYTLYGRLATLHFRYLTCLLDRGHIKKDDGCFLCYGRNCYTYNTVKASDINNLLAKSEKKENELVIPTFLQSRMKK